MAYPNNPPTGAGARLPLLLSGLALITALVAAGVALVALSKTSDGGTPAVVAGSSTSVTPPPITALPTGPTSPGEPSDLPTDATATTAPSLEPTGEPTGGPDPSGTFTVAYPSETLRLQPSSSRSVDLDTPTGNAPSGTYEFSYTGSTPNLRLYFSNDVAVAEIQTPNPNAGDCAVELRRAPIDSDVVPAKGKMLCVLTSADRAASQGNTQKLVLLRMATLTEDGTLNLSLTAWNVPT